MNVRSGFEEKDRYEVASLYTEAFLKKFVNVLGEREVLLDLFYNSVNAKYCFSAYDGDILMGIAGFAAEENGFIEPSIKWFIGKFGWLKGVYKALYLSVIFRKRAPNKAHLIMEGIAVKSAFRGCGAGTALFEQLTAYAESQGYTGIRLDVIDDNPKAKALYSRLGFQVIHHETLPQSLQKKIHVSGVSRMVKSIGGGDA